MTGEGGAFIINWVVVYIALGGNFQKGVQTAFYYGIYVCHYMNPVIMLELFPIHYCIGKQALAHMKPIIIAHSAEHAGRE